MSVAAIPTSYSANAPIFVTDRRDSSPLRPTETTDRSDVQLRSERYALALHDAFQLPQDVATAFLNPIALETTDNSLVAASETISELLNPRSIHESMTPIRFEHHQRLVRGLACSLAWLYDRSPWHENSLVEQSALQALIPLYWIPANESWEKQLNQSLHHLRRHASFLLWRDSLEDVDIQAWLRRMNGNESPLAERVESAFRLCLSHLSQTFWSQLASQYQRSRLPGANNLSRELERETWALATSLLRKGSSVQLPTSFASASMAIDDIRSHWIRLRESLANRNAMGADDTENKLRALPPVDHSQAHRFVSIADRNSSPLLASLKQALESEENESLVSLAVVRAAQLDSTRLNNASPAWIASLCNDEELAVKGMFKTEGHDWVIVYSGVDRSELARKIREVFETLSSQRSREERSPSEQAFVAGVATVIDPTSSFQVTGLVDGAWRCLEAAQLQGPNAVKTIQVY